VFVFFLICLQRYDNSFNNPRKMSTFATVKNKTVAVLKKSAAVFGKTARVLKKTTAALKELQVAS